MLDEEIKNGTEGKEAPSAVEETAPVDDSPAPVTDWEAKASEYLNDLKRTQADFENYKKRQAAQQKELAGYLIESLVMDLVPVLDNFRAATEHVPEAEKTSPWVTGIQYIEKQLEKVIGEHGVETISPKEGDAFDPAVHETVNSQQPIESNQQEAVNNRQAGAEREIIAKVIQNGYKIGERVIRPAKVTVI